MAQTLQKWVITSFFALTSLLPNVIMVIILEARLNSKGLVARYNKDVRRNATVALGFEKGEIMKNAFVSMVLGIILCALVFLLSGCGYVVKADHFVDKLVVRVLTLGNEPEAMAQLGETEAEGRRRHLRARRINQRALMQDLDKLFLLDKPSKLTERKIP